MTKSELMENYTMEQLAEMVVDLQKLSEATTVLVNNKADEIKELKTEIHRKETTINQIDEIIEKVFCVTHDIVKTPDEFEKILREKIKSDGEENERLEKEYAEALKRLVDRNDKIDELEKKIISDFLPTEPIEVASMLINAEGEYEHNPIVKAFCGADNGTYNLFNISELRQIAEHLLIYCNANREGEE